MSSASLIPVLVGLLLVAGVSAQNCSSQVITSKPGSNAGSTAYTVDPWIVPSTNTTNGSLPPGVCPFSSYPMINATCKDTITFVSRAVPAGLRVHGVYLIDDIFVNQQNGDYRCPSTAMDVDLRNASTGYRNQGACRGASIQQVIIDGTTNYTAPFTASSRCSGYKTLDPLEVFVPTAPNNCSTANVITKPMGKKPSCYTVDSYKVKLSSFVKKGRTKYLAFSCPNINGNQPGLGLSHCHGKMTVVVKVTC